jgi:hypothetical protein
MRKNLTIGWIWSVLLQVSLVAFCQVSFADERLYFVHRTSVFPWPEMKVGGVFYRPCDLTQPIPEEVPTRMTLHWSMGPVEPNRYLAYGSFAMKPPGVKYIVVEAFESLASEIVGGWVNDFYMVGPYSLSSQSALILPSEEVNRPELASYSGLLVPYPKGDSPEKALDEHLKGKQIHLKFNPVQRDTPRHPQLEFLGKEMMDTVEKLEPDFYVAGIFETKSGESIPVKITKLLLNQTTYYSYEASRDLNYAPSCMHQADEIKPPLETLITITSDKESDEDTTLFLSSLFPKAPFFLESHASSYFVELERAISDENWEVANYALNFIRQKLEMSGFSMQKFDEFVEKLAPHAEGKIQVAIPKPEATQAGSKTATTQATVSPN